MRHDHTQKDVVIPGYLVDEMIERGVFQPDKLKAGPKPPEQETPEQTENRESWNSFRTHLDEILESNRKNREVFSQ